MINQPWKIKPYTSVGPLSFGLNQANVTDLLSDLQPLGPEHKIFDKEENTTTLYWMKSGLQTVFSGRDGPLTMVSIYSNLSPIELNEIDLDWDRGGTFFQTLLKLSTEVYELAGVKVFLDLGVSVLGLESDDNSTKSLTAFAPGAWDEELGSMKRLS